MQTKTEVQNKRKLLSFKFVVVLYFKSSTHFIFDDAFFKFFLFCPQRFVGNGSSNASSMSLNRKSSSSLNSSNPRETFKNAKDFPHSPRKNSGQQLSATPAGAVFDIAQKSPKTLKNKEFVDSGVDEDEVEEMNAQDDFNFTEFSYFKEMEIFHTAVNNRSVSWFCFSRSYTDSDSDDEVVEFFKISCTKFR